MSGKSISYGKLGVGYGKVHGYTGSKLWAFGIPVEHPRRIMSTGAQYMASDASKVAVNTAGPYIAHT